MSQKTQEESAATSFCPSEKLIPSNRHGALAATLKMGNHTSFQSFVIIPGHTLTDRYWPFTED